MSTKAEPCPPAAAYMPTSPAESPRLQGSSNGIDCQVDQVQKRVASLNIADPSVRAPGGPFSPVYLNSAPVNQTPQASSRIENTAYLDQSQTQSAGHSSEVQNENELLSGNPVSISQINVQKLRPGLEPASVSQPPAAVTSPSNKYRTDSPQIVTPDSSGLHNRHNRHISIGSYGSVRSNEAYDPDEAAEKPAELVPSLQYHHRAFSEGDHAGKIARSSMRNELYSQHASPPGHGDNTNQRPRGRNGLLGAALPRPSSAYSSASDLARGPDRSPGWSPQMRATSTIGSRSPDNRRLSYLDLLNVPYPQQTLPATVLDHAHLRTAVGTNASLLSTKKTLEMYRANAKKTNDMAIQYEFAIFMTNTAQEVAASETGVRGDIDGSSIEGEKDGDSSEELLREARQLLQRLSDRGYPFAQYYLADGYASGLLNKGKEDNDRSFPLFVSASKHGHAEAGYRAALCYEFGWGTREDPQKAVQFYRQAASKNHPGAMARLGRACLVGDLGLVNRYREGLTWLKRAAESADFQYNSAPYELGLLHENGYGDDVFRDESYAAQLFTKSADLGHADASYRLGDAYEHGKLNCPRDPALSVHFYTTAAQRGHAVAMMALCAWYMVGAEPILEKDEGEAYEWARKAAELGLPKAEYAVGYFTEMGIGTRRDPLEANVWYVKAADDGDGRAKVRIAAIRTAASGGPTVPEVPPAPSHQKAKKEKSARNASGQGHEGEKGKKKWGIF